MTKWSEHVHRFAKRHKMTYREAQKNKRCKDSYRKKMTSPKKKSRTRSKEMDLPPFLESIRRRYLPTDEEKFYDKAVRDRDAYNRRQEEKRKEKAQKILEEARERQSQREILKEAMEELEKQEKQEQESQELNDFVSSNIFGGKTDEELYDEMLRVLDEWDLDLPSVPEKEPKRSSSKRSSSKRSSSKPKPKKIQF